MNGVSKKLCITALSIGMIMSMSEGTDDKLPYAIVIGVICVIYKLVQAILDYKKNKN